MGHESESDGSPLGLNRDQLTAVGVILIVFGGLLFLGGVFGMTSSQPTGFDSASFQRAQQQASSSFMTAFIGMILLGIGFAAFKLGMVRPVTRYLAEETGPAIQYTSTKVAEGLAEGLGEGGNLHVKVGRGSPNEGITVRVKCRNCGYLETEDATYCSKCGQAI